ncbi:MAG: hypothetical protein RIR25_88 [Verrucomicrobiota bacterium]
MFTKHHYSSGSLVKARVAGNYNLNALESDELETICDAASAHRSKWKTARACKPRSGSSPDLWVSSREKDKIEYRTLAKALAARSRMTRKRGARFRHLRPYKIHGVWFLTKMSKGQVRQFAAGLR